MSDFNHQFLFDQQVAEKPKFKFQKVFSKRTTALTATVAIILGAAVGAGVGAGIGIFAYNYWASPAAVVVNDSKSVTWVTGAAATASPSVVTISVVGTRGMGRGSGVFLTEDGYILTNAHVVTAGGSLSGVKISVQTYDGRVYSSKVVGTDSTNDLAVIKVSAPISFTPITFADSDKINVGDSVLAIGAPLGLSNTVTEGIVSALNRTIAVYSSAVPEDSDSGFEGFQLFSGKGTATNLRVIQTDAAINLGNSGGALVDQTGKLIGINVAIASSGPSSEAGNIGVGFAIPANVAARIAKEIMVNGKASHGLFGAGVVDANSSKDNTGFAVGALIKQLTSGGAAQKAGLKVGDIVVKFDGLEITSAGELTATVRQEPAGAVVEIELLRNSKLLKFDVVLGDAANLK